MSPICIGVVADPDVVSAAFEEGINFFFISADMHWPVYEATRVGLARLAARVPREAFVVATASYVTQPEFLTAPFAEVCDSLSGIDSLDILVAGGSYGTDLIQRLDVLQHHKAGAYLGAQAVGVSFHDRNAARVALTKGLVDIGFVRYNAGHPGAISDLFPHLAARDGAGPLAFNFTSLAGWVPASRVEELGLGGLDWIPQAADHYRFALTRPEVTGVLCAPATKEQLNEIVAALHSPPLSAEDEEYLVKLQMLATGAAELA